MCLRNTTTTAVFAVLAGCGPTVASMSEECERGNGETCHALVTLYSWGRDPTGKLQGELPPKDEALAFRYAELGCRAEHAASCRSLAWSYHYGHGTAVDKVKSIASNDKACELGNGVGCGYAGLERLEQGDSVPAKAPLERGCSVLSDSLSCYVLASQFPAPTETKVALYKKACELEPTDGSGCWAGGALLASTPEGLEQALPLLKIACQRMGSSSRACLDAQSVEAGRVLFTQEICGATPEGETVCWRQEPGNPWGMPL